MKLRSVPTLLALALSMGMAGAANAPLSADIQRDLSKAGW
jgi:hypothetical protein